MKNEIIMKDEIMQKIIDKQSLSKQYRIVYENGKILNTRPFHCTKWHDSLEEAINELNSLLNDDIYQIHHSNDYNILTNAINKLRENLKFCIEERLHISKKQQDKIYSNNRSLYYKKINNKRKKIEQIKSDQQICSSDSNSSNSRYGSNNGKFSTDSNGYTTYTASNGNDIYLGDMSNWKPEYQGQTLEDYANEMLNRAMGGW